MRQRTPWTLGWLALVVWSGCGGADRPPARLIEQALISAHEAGCVGRYTPEDGEFSLPVAGWIVDGDAAQRRMVKEAEALVRAGVWREQRREEQGRSTMAWFETTDLGVERARKVARFPGYRLGGECFAYGELEIEPDFERMAVEPLGPALEAGATVYFLPVRYRVVEVETWAAGLTEIFEKIERERVWQEVSVPIAKDASGWKPVAR